MPSRLPGIPGSPIRVVLATARRADLLRMRQNKPLAGSLALATVMLGALAELLTLLHLGGWFGIALFGVAAVVGVVAWLALGAPVRRAQT